MRPSSGMARYLLDTTVLVDNSLRREPVRSWVADTPRGTDEVGVSTVNVAEYYGGLRPDEREEAERFFDGLRVWDVTRAISVRAGIYRYQYLREGRTLLIPDLLVAATEFVVGAIVVTANVKDCPMPDVQVLPLRA